jgi:DNA polymerase-1
VLTRDALQEVVEAYSAFDHVVFDVETIGGREQRTGGTKNADVPALDERTNVVVWIALAGPGRVDIIPMGHPSIEGHEAPKQLSRYEVLTALKPIFFDPERRKINHNVSFDTLSLAKHWGELPPGPFTDTISLVHVLNENLPAYNLGDLVDHYLGFRYAKLARDGAIDSFGFWDVARYVGQDAKVTQLLYDRLRPLYDLPNRESLRRILELEGDITEVLIHAKQHGALVDRDGFERINAVLSQELYEVTAEIFHAVAKELEAPEWDANQRPGWSGREFLITSTQQRAKLLYGDKPYGLGLPCKVPTNKGAQSTSEKALKPLVRKHPVVRLLLRHAELSKLRSTYTSGFMPHVADDGRIRTSFKQAGAATGRFSSARPNLQNIPRQSDDEADVQIRRLFVAPPGHVLVVGDFGQIEYRVMAHFAGPMVRQSRMLQAFTNEIDLHAMTAAGLFGLPVTQVGKEQRQAGKTANFCLMFGGGPNRLLETGLAKTIKQADEVFEGFHATYPEVEKFTKLTILRCRRMDRPYVETLWGRRRRLPEINTPKRDHQAGKLRAYAERQAVNHIIQGTAADLNKAAMVRAYRRIREWGYEGKMHLILTVHDEIVLEVPEDLAEVGVQLLREAMQGVKAELLVPLVADIHFGPTWADAK